LNSLLYVLLVLFYLVFFSFFAVAFFHASRSSYHGRRRRMMHGQQPSATRMRHVGWCVCKILKDELAFAAALKSNTANLQQLWSFS
jgi:hypothetical protein